MEPIIHEPSFAGSNAIVDGAYSLLTNYLHDSSGNANDTAQSLTALVEPYLTPLDQPQPVEYLWATLFWIVKQLPPNDPRQFSLAEIFLQIREIPLPAGEGRDAYEEDALDQFWTDLPFWRATWSDYEREAPLVPPMGMRPGAIEDAPSRARLPWRGTPLLGSEWTNLNAFLAKLHSASDLPYLDLKGLYALLEALEERQARETVEDLLPAAACWILYAGEALWSNSVPYPHYRDIDGSKRLPWSVGELYHGPKCFSTERWSFWKMRFGVFEAREDLSDEVRTYAAQASSKMSDIERVQRIPSGSAGGV